jgi:hypothetical protein
MPANGRWDSIRRLKALNKVHALNAFLEKAEHQRRTTFHYQQPVITSGTVTDINH